MSAKIFIHGLHNKLYHRILLKCISTAVIITLRSKKFHILVCSAETIITICHLGCLATQKSFDSIYFMVAFLECLQILE